MSHNLFQFIGNITRDVVLSHAESGATRVQLDLAVDRSWRDQSGEKQQKTDFFRIKAFGKLAENAAKYLGKGSKVFVDGRVEPTRFERDGKTVYGIDFIASGIQYLDTKAPLGQG